MQQETTHRSVHLLPQRGSVRAAARTSLPGSPPAASAARRFLRAALAEWTRLGMVATRGADQLADDAVVVVSELVTNAVVHAGTTVEVLVRLDAASEDDPASLVVEVSDRHPARPVRSEPPDPGAASGEPEYGRGLQLVTALAASWGITYRPGLKAVWARLALDGCGPAGPGVAPRGPRAAESPPPAPRRALRDDRDWTGRGALSFLAEASDLLAGQLDEEMVTALAGQLLVPRLADWCAIWLDAEAAGPEPRLARVWHADESAIEGLRTALVKEPPRLPQEARSAAVTVPVARPGYEGDTESGDNGAGVEGGGAASDEGAAREGRETAQGAAGNALAFRLTAGARPLGILLLGREGLPGAGVSDEATALIEDFARRVGLAIGAARAYARQATISRVLQRGLLPAQVAQIPGVDSSLVYEPSDEGLAGGDFYDIFPAGSGGRWCFMLGDVQGSGPEAAVVTGLARPWLRLLAREGYQVGEVLDRLNGLLLDDAMEAAEAAALMVAGPGSRTGSGPEDGPHDGPQSRFLSLLYGELTPLPGGGGVRCTLACAGHPLPLLLRPDGTVRPAAASQLLLGVVEGAAYESQTFDLEPGDTLLCVTDGVTERRSGPLMFDDSDGLARALADCAGLTAQGVADRIRQAVHTFAEAPPGDDLALLVLQAR
ncbi:SpoIIE family protein phosphatase [Streptomyces sp. NPDC057445]|uniref:SpoIIE family protein phosphatase n=1 Tax=Streptomyces sp. NPDC057445 TaxID=3346136 RepID=UPI00369EBD6E